MGKFHGSNWNVRRVPLCVKVLRWMQVKKDGVRGYWDGEGKMWAKNMRTYYHIPASSILQLPKGITLDGELWCGEGISKCVGILNKKRISEDDWKMIKYFIFDSPTYKGTYEERYDFLNTNIKEWKNSHLELIPMVKCESKEHYKTYLKEVKERGEEGLILRKSSSSYEPGESNNLFKADVTHLSTFIDVPVDH